MTVRQTLISWTVRLLLAALFLFGGEILLWTGIRQYTLIDWLVRGVGYIALSVVVLDVAARYRIRDIYDAMIVFAMYGLLASLLISPTISFAKFPLSILTRVLGGQTLLGFEMWGFFLVLIAGNKRRYRWRLLAVAAWLAFYWGIWMRWTPELSPLFDDVSLQIMFSYAVGFFVPVLLLYGILTRMNMALEPLDFRLSNGQWGVLLVLLIGLFLYQFYFVGMSIWPVVAVALLLVVCWSVLWFRREDEGQTLLDDHLPIMPLSPLWLILTIGLFIVVTLISYHLPLVGTRDINQLWLMEMGFGAVGVLWLPLVAAMLSVRGLDHLMRTNQLQ